MLDGKNYSDKKRRAKDDTIEIGDKVYVKHLVKENKLTPNFNSTPHTVVDKQGCDANIQNDETKQELRINVVHLKKVEGEWKVIDNSEVNKN